MAQPLHKHKEGPWYDEAVTAHIEAIISHCGGELGTFDADLVAQIIVTALKLLKGHDTGQLKLINRAMREMRYAFSIFKSYPLARRVSIFGSARTPPDHPDYVAARAFSAAMAECGWMCITGGAQGIMKAGLEGQQSQARFGLSIRLPFEKGVNELLEGDPKSMSFRYFFTRKVMFMVHADAFVVFPGGVGTLDELYEALTLMQTGKSSIVPIILMEGFNGAYWHLWQQFMTQALLQTGMVHAEDFNFFHIAHSVTEGVAQISRFYSRYHSSRYVGDLLVLRLLSTIPDSALALLNAKYSSLLASGTIQLGNAHPEEKDFLELPRLFFHHNKRHFGLLRALIDDVNNC